MIYNFQPGDLFLNRDGDLITIATVNSDDPEYPIEDTNGDVYTDQGNFYDCFEETGRDLVTPLKPRVDEQVSDPASKVTVIVSNVSTGETYGSMTLQVPANFEDLGFSFLPHKS